MANAALCDVCRKQITEENPIEYKLFLAPVRTGATRSTHSDYTHHMDVGKCCVERVTSLGLWQLRKKQQRNNGSRRTVASAKHKRTSAAK